MRNATIMNKNQGEKKKRQITSKKRIINKYLSIFSIIILLTGVFVITPSIMADPNDSWYDSGWLYRKEIVIHHTMISQDLTNYPVLIDTIDNDLFLHAQSNGNDIVFTNKTGTKISHEIESYNSVNGHLIVWVNVPSLSSTIDTSIYMYYGNPSASNQQNVVGTWNSGFKAVYHLKESWSTSAGHFKDSTANHYNGTLNDLNGNSASDTGIAGPGFRFNGDADFINIGVINHPQPITYSCWFKTNNIDDNKGVLSRDWNYYFLGTWNTGPGVLRHSVLINSVRYYQHTSGASNVWYLMTVAYDGSTVRYYVNGSQVGSNSVSGSLTGTTYPWHIGDNGNGALFFAGVVDEVRIANTCLSSGWISAYYGNVNSPSSFYSVGAQEMQTPSTLTLTTSGTGSGTIEVNRTGPYYIGDTVKIWANASVGSTFTGFSGSLTGTTTPQTLVIDGDETVDAEFTRNGPYPLTLTTSGTGSGTIAASPAGPYYYGATVTIWANASVGSTFTGFTGSLTGITTPQTFIIHGNEAVNAEFTVNGPYTLTLTSSGTGSGTIAANRTGPYYLGDSVKIWANASVGSTFTGFTGSLTGITTPQILIVDGNEAVDAEFTVNGPYALTLTTSGTGSGTIAANRTGPYYIGDRVKIWANASVGSTFTGFTGSLNGTTTPQTLIVHGNEAVNAEFTLNGPYQLIFTTSGTGSGSITASPDGPYFYGAVVSISANAAVGSTFTGFSGGLTGPTNPQTLTIDSDKNIDAEFTLKGPYTLTLTKNGTGIGTIQASPAGPYYYGTTVTIWANASVGSAFIGFNGSLTGTTTPQTLTIDGNKTVNAEFTLYTPGPLNWWNTSWSYRKKILIDHSQVTENLINFPILIDIVSGDLIGHAQSDADDFVFTTDGTPTKLSHEIELYDSGTGHVVAWVNIPSLSSTVDTSIYMYYGNPSASNQQNVVGTWNSGFKAVYHLKESWSTTAGHFKDSTVNHHNGTLTDVNGNSASDTGIAGPGFRFNGDADFINIGVINHPQPITYSCWFKADNIDDNRGALGRDWNYYFLGTWNTGPGVLRHSVLINSVRYYQQTSGASTVWYLMTVTYDGSTVRYYVDGSLVGSTSVSGSLTGTTYPWHIGDNGNGVLFFKGVVDEVRIANTCLSAGWVSTYYHNVNSPSSFYSVGAQMTRSGLPPAISNEQPANKSVNQGFNPPLQFHVSDPDNDFITCELWTNASGSPQLLTRINFNNGSGDISGTSTDIVDPLTKYWWSVRCTDDGINWVQKTYWFITGNEAPLITDQSPANNIITNFNPRLSVHVVDYQNDLLTVTFSKKVGASWVTLGTYSGHNGLYTQNTTNMDDQNQTYSWKVTVSDGENTVETPTYSFTVKPFVLKWVRPNAPSTDMGPIAADVNGDGIYEVFMLGTGTIFCVNGSTGNVIWQYDNDRIYYHSQCILADLNNDGIDEIVISCMFAESGIQPITIALHANNGSVYWIAPVSSDYRHFIIADTDGTGYPYVFVVSHYAFGYISKLRGTDGTVVARTRVYYPCHGGMSMADLDNDGKIELILADYGALSTYLGKGMHCYDADTLKLKWYNPSTRADPQLGMLVDVNNDGILDIITTVYHYGGIQIINGSTGQVMRYGLGSSQYPNHSPNSVYDIDGDGHLEVLGCSDSPVRVYDLTNWNIEKVFPESSQEPPLMADVIGDSKLEILLTSWSWDQGIVIYNSTYQKVGQIKRGSSRWTLVQDVDNDGQNELLFTDSDSLVCYDTSAYAPIPRVRSNQVGYSERCTQAGIYTPPPGAPQPVLKDEYPKNCSLDVPINPTLSFHAVEYQVHVLENYHIVEHQYDKMNIVISMSTNPNGPWQNLTAFTNVGNGVYTVPTTTMNQPATTYYWRVIVKDINSQAGGITTTKIYHFTTQSPPTIGAVSISPSSPYQGQQVTFSAAITDDVHVGETKLRITGPNGFTPENNTVYKYQWTTFTYDDFESGWGHYTSGGADCFRYQKVSETADKSTWPLIPQGTWAADIQADSGVASSFNLTNPIDVHTQGFDEIKIDFWMNAYGMGYGQKYYLEYFDGTQWITRKTYEQNWGSFAPSVYTDTYYKFANWINFHDTVLINKSTYNFPTNMNIRFRCASTGGISNDVFIDKIYINATHLEPTLYSSIESFTVLGMYNYSFWSKDINGNTKASATYQFTVLNDASRPQITNVLATPSSATQGIPVNITCNVEDNAGLQDVRVVLTDPNANTVNYSIVPNKINPSTYYSTQTYTTVGTYQFHIWAKDVNSNTNSSSAYQFTVLADTSPPQITAVGATPASGNPSTPINISCSVQDNVGLQDVRVVLTDPNANTMNYSIVTNKINPSTYYSTQIYTTVGTYQFHIWAKDVNGNSAVSAMYSFEIVTWPKLTDWQYRKQITISHSQVSKNLSTFPLLIDIRNDNDLATKAQDDFDDILFTNASVSWQTGYSNDRLAHEIESCNGVTGNLTVWVNLPFLSSTQDIIIYMYYGNPQSGNQQQPTQVWSNNFVLVQHLNETSGLAYDSTSFNNDGTIQNNVNQNAIGRIDGADGFDGVSSLVHVQDSNSLDLGTTGTISAWIKLNTYKNNGGIVHKGDLSTFTDEAYGIQLWTNNKLRFYISNSGGDYYLQTTNNIGSTTWFYIVGTWNASGRYLYVNGALNASSSSAQTPRITTGGVNIGSQITQSSYYSFDGVIDEMQISSVSRDSSWIHTNYLNQQNPSSFISVGAEESH